MYILFDIYIILRRKSILKYINFVLSKCRIKKKYEIIYMLQLRNTLKPSPAVLTITPGTCG